MLTTLQGVRIVQDLLRGARVRARRKTLPTLLVPITRGPIQNFYHFFMGYFVPLYWQRMQHPDREMAVMSVLPFDHWFDLLPGGAPKIIDQAKAMKQAFLSDRRGYSRDYRVEGIMYWDKWEHFPDRPLREVSSQLQQDLADQTHQEDVDTPEIVVLSRDYTPDLYSGQSAKSYGAAKRNIPNLDEVVRVLSREHSVEIVDGASVSPEAMFLKCSRARLLLGQHGAGLTNVFLAKPGSAMVEIVWPEFLSNAHINIYGPLCDELGIRWSRPVLQQDPHSTVSPAQVQGQVQRMMEV